MRRPIRMAVLASCLAGSTGCAAVTGLDQTYGDQPASGDGGAPASSSAPSATDASPILQVHSGATNLAADAATQSVTLGALDPSKSFVVFGTQFDSTTPGETEVTGQLDGTSELVFTRALGTGAPAMPIRYYVAEFQGGVHVQRGATTMSATTMTVALSESVDLAHSFPLITYRNSGTTYNLDDYVRAKLTGPTELSLAITSASSNGVAEWQVVSFDGAEVQSGDLTLGTNDITATATLGHAANPASTWVLLSNQVNDTTGTTGELLVSGHLASPTTLTLDRAVGGATNQVTFYTVTFTNGTAVQSSTLLVADQATSASSTVAEVDPTRSIPVASGLWQMAGTTSYAAASDPGYGVFLLDLGAGSELSLSRGASGSGTQSSIACSVISFF